MAAVELQQTVDEPEPHRQQMDVSDRIVKDFLRRFSSGVKVEPAERDVPPEEPVVTQVQAQLRAILDSAALLQPTQRLLEHHCQGHVQAEGLEQLANIKADIRHEAQLLLALSTKFREGGTASVDAATQDQAPGDLNQGGELPELGEMSLKGPDVDLQRPPAMGELSGADGVEEVEEEEETEEEEEEEVAAGGRPGAETSAAAQGKVAAAQGKAAFKLRELNHKFAQEAYAGAQAKAVAAAQAAERAAAAVEAHAAEAKAEAATNAAALAKADEEAQGSGTGPIQAAARAQAEAMARDVAQAEALAAAKAETLAQNAAQAQAVAVAEAAEAAKAERLAQVASQAMAEAKAETAGSAAYDAKSTKSAGLARSAKTMKSVPFEFIHKKW